MHEHLQSFEHAHVHAQVSEYGPGIAIQKLADPKRKRLLVLLLQGGGAEEDLSVDPRGKDVGDRSSRSVFFEIHRIHFKDGVAAFIGGYIFPDPIQGEAVASPFSAHQIHRGKAQDHRLLKIGQEHAHEANGAEVIDRTHALVGKENGDLELIPGGRADLPVGQLDARSGESVGDVVLTYDHVLGPDAHLVLIVALRFAHGLVPVQVLHIGQLSGRLREAVHLLSGGVVLRVVEEFVPIQYVAIRCVVVGGEVVFEIVSGRVCRGRLVGSCALSDIGRDPAQIAERAVHRPVGFLCIVESIQTHVLIHSRGRIVVKCSNKRLVPWHVTPDGRIHYGGIACGRHSVFEHLSSILQYVFRDGAQIEIQIASFQ